MKAFLIAVFVGFSLAQVQNPMDNIIKNTLKKAEECKQLTNATEDIQQLANTFTLPTTPEGKCMVACVMQDMGLMKNETVDSGAVHKYAQKVLPPLFLALAEPLLKKCHSSGSSSQDGCDNAVAYVACARNSFEKDFPWLLPPGVKTN